MTFLRTLFFHVGINHFKGRWQFCNLLSNLDKNADDNDKAICEAWRFLQKAISKEYKENPKHISSLYPILYPTLQMFTGNYRDCAVKSECRDFKFMEIACMHAIPVILKSPHFYFHCNICREFAFTGILWGFPALDVGQPCNNLIFGDIHAKFAGLFCKF